MNRIQKKLAEQVAKVTTKENFLQQLGEACVLLLQQHEGDVDVEVEVAKMKKRVQETGLNEVFGMGGITDEDIEQLVREAVKKAGKGTSK